MPERTYKGQDLNDLDWKLLLAVTLAAGMRRGEALNATWRDVDCDTLTMEVNAKDDTEET